MKFFLYSLCCAFVLTSCEGEGTSPIGRNRMYFVRNLIVSYYDGGIMMEKDMHEIYVKPDPNSSYCFYTSPDVLPGSADSVAFFRIAARNGDVSYNQEESYLALMDRICFADNFKEVHLTYASITGDSWDSTHPDGTSLDDAAQLEFFTCQDYVRAGYPVKEERGHEDFEDVWRQVRKPLSQLTASDLSMIQTDYGLKLTFDNPPSSGVYELTMTMIPTEGSEKTATYTYNAALEK